MDLRSFATAPVVSPQTGAAPTVFDKIISLTIVDPSGARRKIKGMIGESFKLAELGNTTFLYCLVPHLDTSLNRHICNPIVFKPTIRFLLGTTLYEACESNEVELGPSTIGGPSQIIHSERWTEPVFGEGPTSGYDHVVLSGPGANTAAPVTRSESRMIEDYWDFDEVFQESRLASMVTLTKQMDGMIVYVPPRVDDSNP